MESSADADFLRSSLATARRDVFRKGSFLYLVFRATHRPVFIVVVSG
jgi:hypothetical protein